MKQKHHRRGYTPKRRGSGEKRLRMAKHLHVGDRLWFKDGRGKDRDHYVLEIRPVSGNKDGKVSHYTVLTDRPAYPRLHFAPRSEVLVER